MKKIILTVAVFTIGFVNAQEVKYGAKAGLNFANLTGDVEDASMKIGFNVGGFAEIKVSDKFSVQPELLYSTQGAKSEESFEGETIESEWNLSYLNIPIMAKYYVSEKFSLEAGPQIGFLLGSKVKVESIEVDFKDNTESIDFGLNIGSAYDFTENLFAGLRYNIGLSNVAKTESGDDTKINNSVISLSLGYRF
jgi:opacity protein-like surface antigen